MRLNKDGGKGYAPRYEQKQLHCLPNSQTDSSQIKIQYIYIYIYNLSLTKNTKINN